MLVDTARSAMAWVTGQKIYGDRYTIERRLGSGGCGITYLAINKKGNLVVIKTLKDEIFNKPHFEWYQEKFLEEALQLSLCRHPNIVKIENAFKHEEYPCIVMEYIQGENLQQLVSKRGILTQTEAVGYIRQIGSALTVVHDLGLLHRDIKPSNIMLRATDREAVLIDFGLARGFIPDSTQNLTIGYTHGFAPPEQYLRETRWGEYTDVYAIASTLYYLLTGHFPDAAPIRALQDSLQKAKNINPQISDRVNEAIDRGMKLEINERSQNIQEWLELLESEIDYQRLDNLLAAGKWKEADEETKVVMLKAAGRQKEGWLDIDSIDNFPIIDLNAIDQLWVKYSKGRFGFSIQQRIYQEIGVTANADDKIYEKFAARVGWMDKRGWLSYDELDFSQNAVVGHLPSDFWNSLLCEGSIHLFLRLNRQDAKTPREEKRDFYE